MDIDSLITVVNLDPSLSQAQKKELSEEQNRKKLAKMLSGVGGAALMLAVSRYTSMGKIAQLALAALGFGAGKLVYDYFNRNKFANYNEETGTYEIDTTRY